MRSEKSQDSNDCNDSQDCNDSATTKPPLRRRTHRTMWGTGALLALACFASACGDSKSSNAGTGGGATGGASATGGAGPGSGGASGAAGNGTGGAGGAAAIPLTVWVDDLVVNHSTDVSAPDTVDDKNIADTDDPAAFDPLLKR